MQQEDPSQVKGWKFSELVIHEKVNSFWGRTPQECLKSIEAIASQGRNDDEFRKQVLKKFSKEERKQLTKCTNEELKGLISECIEDAQRADSEYQKLPGRGKKAGRGLVKFLTNAQEYYKTYSGLGQLVDAVAPGSSAAANSAFAVLLVVAVNKKKTSDLMDDAFNFIQKQISQLEILEGVYDTDQVKVCIAKVYTESIILTRDAALHYARGSWGRIWRSVIRPPVFLEQRIQGLKDSVAEMKGEMLTLLHKRVYTVSEDLTKMAKDLEFITAGVITDRQSCLEKFVTPEGKQLKPGFMAERTRCLSDTFRFTKYRPFDVEQELYNKSVFQDWTKSGASSLLIIQGRTVDPWIPKYSWLSIIATSLSSPENHRLGPFSHLRPDPFTYVCQIDGFEPEKVPAHRVLATLIWQMLRTTRAQQVLQDNTQYRRILATFEDSLAEPGFSESISAEKFERLCRVFAMLLAEFEFEQICLVIDHVDRIQGDKVLFFGWLAQLLKESPAIMKAVVVGDSIDPMLEEVDIDVGKVQRFELDQDFMYR